MFSCQRTGCEGKELVEVLIRVLIDSKCQLEETRGVLKLLCPLLDSRVINVLNKAMESIPMKFTLDIKRL